MGNLTDQTSRARFLFSSRRTALSLGVPVLYCLAFVPVYHLIGRVVILLAVIPLILIADTFGPWAGLATGVMAIPVHIVLYLLAGESGGIASFTGSYFWGLHLVFARRVEKSICTWMMLRAAKIQRSTTVVKERSRWRGIAWQW